MLKGIYSAAAGMTSQLLQTDVMSDNMANLSTPGFKPSAVQYKAFKELLVNRMSKKGEKSLGGYAKGSEVMSTIIQFKQGDLQQTGNPLDLALQGDGFFVMKDPKTQQTIYSRAGTFTLDDEGYIVNENKFRVQGSNGDIRLPKTVDEIEVGKNGLIDGDGRKFGRMLIAQFENTDSIKKFGGNSFVTDQTPSFDAKDVTVEQGHIEKSAANAVTEMVSNIQGLRAYETMQKSIEIQNQTLGEAIHDVGRPQ